jgi:hypothetical protein
MTFILSGFADEISPELDDQLAILAAESISHLELRSVWSTNVADVGGRELASFRRALDDAGVRVSAIGSPIGKIELEAPLGPELERCDAWPTLPASSAPRSCASSRSSSRRGHRRSATSARSSTVCALSHRSPKTAG